MTVSIARTRHEAPKFGVLRLVELSLLQNGLRRELNSFERLSLKQDSAVTVYIALDLGTEMLAGAAVAPFDGLIDARTHQRDLLRRKFALLPPLSHIVLIQFLTFS